MSDRTDLQDALRQMTDDELVARCVLAIREFSRYRSNRAEYGVCWAECVSRNGPGLRNLWIEAVSRVRAERAANDAAHRKALDELRKYPKGGTAC